MCFFYLVNLFMVAKIMNYKENIYLNFKAKEILSETPAFSNMC